MVWVSWLFDASASAIEVADRQTFLTLRNQDDPHISECALLVPLFASLLSLFASYPLSPTFPAFTCGKGSTKVAKGTEGAAQCSDRWAPYLCRLLFLHHRSPNSTASRSFSFSSKGKKHVTRAAEKEEVERATWILFILISTFKHIILFFRKIVHSHRYVCNGI